MNNIKVTHYNVRAWGPSSLLHNGYRELFAQGTMVGAWT